MDALLEKVSRCCASTGNTCRTYLNIAFKDAVIEGYIPRNLISDTKFYKRKRPNFVFECGILLSYDTYLQSDRVELEIFLL